MEKAKEIVRLVKDSKKKAQVTIMGDTVRISSKDRDVLQGIIALLRGKDMGAGAAVYELPNELSIWIEVEEFKKDDEARSI